MYSYVRRTNWLRLISQVHDFSCRHCCDLNFVSQLSNQVVKKRDFSTVIGRMISLTLLDSVMSVEEMAVLLTNLQRHGTQMQIVVRLGSNTVGVKVPRT